MNIILLICGHMKDNLRYLSYKGAWARVLFRIYLHITRHTRVRAMMIKAATEAPIATPSTSPSTSH